MFKKGDRVRLNAVWLAQNGGVNCCPPVGTKGTIVGGSVNPACVGVVFDGQKTRQSFHQTFLTKLRRVK
jgi:hypothetical protein